MTRKANPNTNLNACPCIVTVARIKTAILLPVNFFECHYIYITSRMRGVLNCLFYLQIVFVTSLQPRHAEIVRDLMKRQNAPEFVTIQDSIQHDQLAFTSA